MPTYDYRCRSCDHAFEHFQGIHDARLRKCPECGRRTLERLFGIGAGVVFKGSGFYETDYKRSGRKEPASSDTGGDASDRGKRDGDGATRSGDGAGGGKAAGKPDAGKGDGGRDAGGGASAKGSSATGGPAAGRTEAARRRKSEKSGD